MSTSPTRDTHFRGSGVPKTPPKSTKNAPKAMQTPSRISHWFLHWFFMDFLSILGRLVAPFCDQQSILGRLVAPFCDQQRLKWVSAVLSLRPWVLLGSFSSTRHLQIVQMVPKWIQNGAKMDPKWNQTQLKLDPKCSQNGTSSEHKSRQNENKIEVSID